MSVELLLDAGAELAEGPIWDPARAALTWVDQLAGTVNHLGLDGVAGPSISLGARVGCAVPAAAGGVVAATPDGFVHVAADGREQLLAAVPLPGPGSFINDGRCDALGRLWAGTIGVGADGRALPGAGSLHRLDPDATVTEGRRGLTLSNGIDWSPDGSTLYLVDSATGGIDAHRFDLAAGIVGAARRAVDLRLPRERGFADGLCVDADGALWTAVWGTGEVRRYTPTGTLDRTIRLPVSRPTSCTFAGPALDVLVITTAWHQLPADARAREPHAGGVFCCRPGASGRPEHRFGVPA